MPFGAKAALLALALVTFISQLYLIAVVYKIFEISDVLDLVPTVCFAETKETLDIFSAYTFDKLVSNAPSVLRWSYVIFEQMTFHITSFLDTAPTMWFSVLNWFSVINSAYTHDKSILICPPNSQ